MSNTQKSKLVEALKTRTHSESCDLLSKTIITKSGDAGVTELLFGRKVPKWDLRIRLLGKIDTLSSLLNLCKSSATETRIRQLNQLHENMVYVMGEVATDHEDLERFLDNFHSITEADILKLESNTATLEEKGAEFTGWVEDIQGASAFAEIARTAAREAESMAWELEHAKKLRPVVCQWLNRVADYLWALARMPDL